MIANFPEFTNLEANHKQEVEKFTNLFPPYSDQNFTSMLGWDINSQTQLSILNNNLVIKFKDYESDKKFFSFIGKNLIEDTIKKLIEFSKQNNHGEEILLIPKHNFTEDQLKQLSENYSLIEDRDNYDYLLDVNQLSTFEGTNFLNKRNKLNNFLKNHHPKLVLKNIDDKSFQAELIVCFKEWLKRREKTHSINETNNDEFLAFQRLLNHSNLLSIYALGIYINDKLEGFSLFEILNNEYAQHPFQKANKDYKGIYEFLYHNLGKHLKAQGIKYLNIYQDLGHEGMRKGKMDYNPEFLTKYKISKKLTDQNYSPTGHNTK